MRKRRIDTIPKLRKKTHKILDTFSKSRTLAASLVKRSKIILMASQGMTNQKISAKIGLHYDNVATWRNRFLENLPNLNELENAAPEKLSDEIVRILSDEKRSGTPPKFTPEQIMQIISLACNLKPGQWSLKTRATPHNYCISF